MKKFFSTKKYLRILSAFIVCCIVLGSVGTYPLVAQGSEESQYEISNGKTVLAIESVEDGDKVTYTSDAPSSSRIRTAKGDTYNAAKGIHLEVKDIMTSADDYTFVVAFGDSDSQWSDKAGYMLVYGNKGHFEIFPTKTKATSPVAAGLEVVEVQREPLGNDFSLDIKLVDEKYVITVNGDTYTIPAVNPNGTKDGGTVLNDTKYLSFGFGIQGGIDPTTGDVQYDKYAYEPKETPAGSSFILAELSNNYETPEIDNTEIGTQNIALTLSDVTYSQDDAANNIIGYAEPQQLEGTGVKFSHKENTSATAHMNTVKAYDTIEGVRIDIADIASKSAGEDYSIAVSIGKNEDQWTDKAGYMLVYGKSGELTIVKTADGKSYEDGTVLVSVKLDALGSELTVYVQKQSGDKDYVITVNGISYTIHDVDNSIKIDEGDNKDKIYFGVGILNGQDDATFSLIQISDQKFVPQEVNGYTATANIFLEGNANTLKATYTNNPVVSNERVYTMDAYDATKGIHIEIQDLTVPEGTDYSFAVSIGNDSEQWYNKEGYMLVYGNEGHFGIVPSADESQVPVDIENKFISLKRETLGTDIILDIIQKNDTYIITVNEAVYSIPALENNELYFAFGILGGADVTEDSSGNQIWNGVEWSNVKLGEGASFVLSGITDEYQTPEIGEVEKVEGDAVPTLDDVIPSIGKYDILEDGGISVQYNDNSGAYGRMNSKTAYSTNTGIHLEVENIVASDADYSFAVSIGNADKQWYDSRGYMIFYDNQGNFSILAMKGENFKIGEILVSLKREPLTDSYVMDLKLQGDNYMITVNGKTYTIPAKHHVYPISDAEQVYLGLGLLDGGKVKTGNFNISKEFADARYTITKLYSVEDDSVVDKKTPPDWMKVTGTNFEFEETEQGVIITHLEAGGGGERVTIKNAYLLDGEGVTLDIKDIMSESENFSLVVGLGGSKAIWYDKLGCMVLYGKSGNVAAVGTSGVSTASGKVENMNDAEVLAWKKTEYKDSLTLNVKIRNENYVITINGTEYIFDGAYLSNLEQVYLTLGVMSDYVLDNGDISELKYWEDNYKNKKVSFTIQSVSGELSGVDYVGTPIDPETQGMKITGDNITLHEAENGVKVVHGVNAAGWERVAYRNKFSTLGDGIHLEFVDITSKSRNYSLAIHIGSGWYAGNGYMIIYGKDGQFSIIATSEEVADINKSPIIVSEKREALGETLSVDVQLKGTNYKITVNGKLYTVPAYYEINPLNNVKQVKVEIGVIGGGTVETLKYKSSSFKYNYVSFVIEEASGLIGSNLDEELGMNVTGNSWKIEETNAGIKVTQGVSGTSWERVSLKDTYATTEGGIQIELADIISNDPNYSLAVMLSNVNDPWYDCTGYMLIYGKNGNFSIIATDASIINPNKSPLVMSEVREPLGKTLSINVRLAKDNYKITVNGKIYTIPAEHDDYKLSDLKNLYLAFGIMSDGEIGGWVIDKEYRKSTASFTIASVYHSNESVADEEIEGEVEGPVEEQEEEETIKKEPTEENTTNVVAIVCMIGGVLLLSTIITGIIICKKKKEKRAGEEA